MTVRVGVIGLGKIGTEHVKRLVNEVGGATVSAVFDIEPDRAEAAAALTGARTHRDWAELVHDSDVEAVLIASPSELHVEQVLGCVQAGKPVLCEKPLGVSATEAQQVIAAEVAVGRRLAQVGFMRRYDSGFLDVKAAMRDGAIGEPLLAHAVHRGPWVPESFVADMALTESAVHEFDTFRWLFEQELVAVTVIGVRHSPLAAAELRDPQILLLELANGAVVTVEVFVNCRYGYDVRCEVVGSTGTVTLEDARMVQLRSEGRRSEGVSRGFRSRFAEAYLQELRAWIDGTRAGLVTGPDAWDGYVAAAVADAALAAAQSGDRTGVTLVDRPQLYQR